MAISLFERDDIKKEAVFLEEYGYVITEDKYSINYTLDNLSIIVAYPPNSDESDISIHFKNLNQIYSVGWIALVRNNIEGSINKLENIKELLKYLKVHYSEITNYEFCAESNKLIDEYIETHREMFDKAVLNFLNKQ